MYNVLIVDDNLITKKSIMLTIDWSKLGCKVIADADNGMTALDLVKQHKPDLIITDIRMPGMDGLELTEKVKDVYPWIKVIIVTSYSEFTYAKEALRLGAFNLIVKPIDNDELSNVIKKAVAALDAERKEQSEKEYLKNAIKKNKNLLIGKAVIESIEGISTNDISEIQKYFILSINCKINFKSQNDDSYYYLIEGSNKAAEALKLHYSYDFIYFWYNKYFTVIVTEKNGQSPKLTNEVIIEICNDFIKSNSTIFKDNYIIGISKYHSKSKDIKLAYVETIDALESSFYFSNKKVIFCEMIKDKGVINESVLIKKIYDSIKSSNSDNFIKAIDEMRDTIIYETPCIQSVKSLLSNICFIALDYYYNMKGYQFYNYKSHSEISSEINAINNFDDMITYVKNFIEILIKCPNNESKENYSKVTLQVINYLNEHYDKKVSLQEISDYVSLSPSHLSRVIKKDTGESFVDLLNKIKINVAEKLLKESNLKVYEVASKVGIDNYSYFYQLFKKATGIAPTEYYSSRSVEQSGQVPDRDGNSQHE